MIKTLEICCYNVNDVVRAYEAGADRIEFCSGRAEGGLTASYAALSYLAQLSLPIPIHPIIRPRGGDFYYSNLEKTLIINDLKCIKELGFKGVVIGALTEFGQLDHAFLEILMTISSTMEVTFHRAYDVCAEPIQVAKELAQLGVKRILTSGQKGSAIEGVSLISQLLEQENVPSILVGGGVNSSNIRSFLKIGVNEFHASATCRVASSMKFKNSDVKMGDPKADEFLLYQVSDEEVRRLKSVMVEFESTIRRD